MTTYLMSMSQSLACCQSFTSAAVIFFKLITCMSAELYCASEIGENNAGLQGTTLGGSKPLHRFMKGQPKITGLIACGILYILTEHNTTKKTVTISLALSIVTVLVTCLTLMYIVPSIIGHHFFGDVELVMDNVTAADLPQESYQVMGITLEHIILVYAVAAGHIVLVMSCLAGAALRSSTNRAVVVMTATPAEPPVEQRAQEEGVKCDTVN
uniref:uncharacterized protein LOC117251199 isoform X3 n=1 Tax=Epinephelus lanceolatus TaxID=310571 RepID=UPI0014458BF7|nr:uncharacterized protein LOC117251199 isoform X3 [Epinephelus lanceolatus]